MHMHTTHEIILRDVKSNYFFFNGSPMRLNKLFDSIAFLKRQDRHRDQRRRQCEHHERITTQQPWSSFVADRYNANRTDKQSKQPHAAAQVRENHIRVAQHHVFHERHDNHQQSQDHGTHVGADDDSAGRQIMAQDVRVAHDADQL